MKRFVSLLVSAVLLLAVPTQAADLKISQLSTAGSVASSDEFVINKSGATKKVTLSTIDTSLGVSTHTGDATIHRSINDSTTSATGLWSSSKISTELGLKANSTHSHDAGDITSGTLDVSRGGTGLSTIPSNKLLYTSALDTLASLSYDSTLGITAGTIGVQNNTSTQKVVVSKAGTTTGTRRQINLIEGSGISITTADNSGSDRVDVTIATSSAAYPKGYLNGPAPTYSTANQVIIPTGLKARNGANTADIEVTSNITVDLSASGAAGRCDGTDAANTWFYYYLIRKSSDGTVSACASTVNETVSGTITYPSGYDQKRQLPMAVRNNASSNILKFYITEWGYNPTIWYDVEFRNGSTDTAGDTVVLDNGASATFAALSLASYVPPISDVAILHIAQTTAGTKFFVRPTGSSLTNGKVVMTYDEATIANIVTLTNSSQSVDYKTTSTRLDVGVEGFKVTRGNF